MASQSALALSAFVLSTALAACIGDPVSLGGGHAGGGDGGGAIEGDGGGGTSEDGGGGQADAASPCTTSADCAPRQVCGFREGVANACSGEQGQCFTPEGVVCNSVLLGCACDGTEVNMVCNGLPSGYATKPVAHAGECTDGSFGADAASPCTTSADCPPQELCGFHEYVANACSGEQGWCFATSGAVCNSVLLACACDGTEVNMICNGLPSDYATKPIAHAGACTDGSSGD
jgi:hypothetical protein